MDDKIVKLAELIKSSKGVVVLTGAGISTASGIPDFRSSDGIWNKINPFETLTKTVLEKDPEKFYRYYYPYFEDSMIGIRPNRGHEILAEMEAKGLISAVITQNIDGLHTAAGSKNIVEVHGTMRYDMCSCGRKYSKDVLRQYVSEGKYKNQCECGGTIRPAVVLFDDQVVAYPKARQLVCDNELLICIGTSLNVYPVAYLPDEASKVAIINKQVTNVDRWASVAINTDINETLEQLITLL